MPSKLRLTRILQDRSITECAKEAGYSLTYWSGVELGIFKPSQKFRQKSSRVLKVDPEEIFTVKEMITVK